MKPETREAITEWVLFIGSIMFLLVLLGVAWGPALERGLMAGLGFD